MLQLLNMTQYASYQKIHGKGCPETKINKNGPYLHLTVTCLDGCVHLLLKYNQYCVYSYIENRKKPCHFTASVKISM